MKSKRIANIINTNKTLSQTFNEDQLSIPFLQKKLSDKPSLINSIDNKGETLLSNALKQNNNKIYDLLLNSPFLYLNFQDKDGNSYLHLAVKNQNEKIVKNLIEKGINLNLQNNLGNTALHIAYEIGNISIIKNLIKYGINTLIKNNNGKKAEQIKKKFMINKNKSVNNYNLLCETMKYNKGIEYNLTNPNTNCLNSPKNYKDKNIYIDENDKKIIKENGEKYQEKIKINIYTKSNFIYNPKFIIKKNKKEKELKQNENIKLYSTLSTERRNKNFSIKLNDKENLYKVFTLKKNFNKKEEDSLEININKNKKKKNNYLEKKKRESFILQSLESNNKTDKNEIKNINEYEYIDFNVKKSNNKKNNNCRNKLINLSNLNIDKWNSIENKFFFERKKTNELVNNYKRPITKRSSPNTKKDLYNTIINKTLNMTKPKNKNYIDSLNHKYHKFERYINNNKLNFGDNNKIKKIEKKGFLYENEDEEEIEENNDEIQNENNISINRIKKNITENELKDFLYQINMEKYIDILTSNGFDDINLILEQSKNGGIPIQDNELKEAGIAVPGDRAKILIRVQELSNNFLFPIPKDVYHIIEDFNNYENDQHIQKLKKWLENLKIEDYLTNFIYSGYYSVELLLIQMVSNNPLTNEILKEEIGIDKIGYRTRIINKLKDEARNLMKKINSNMLDVNTGEENQNNCQCFIF